jgi:uncharacterized protein
VITIRRLDAGRLGKASRTPQGGVRVAASLTRTGVLPYRQPDGSSRLEYRPATEVFRADSLASLDSAPITRGHAAWITPDNWRDHSLGHVVEGSARKDGALIAAELVIQDNEGMARIDASELGEVSMGYTCDFDPTPGTSPEGERYDGVQRNIRYNHVALLPSGAGRAGRDVALRLDALDVVETRSDAIDPDAAQRVMIERNANAWKGPASNAAASPRSVQQRADAARTIDPDESERRARKRNEDAWKGKSGVQLLGMLEGKDPLADEDGIGPFGMRHGRT